MLAWLSWDWGEESEIELPLVEKAKTQMPEMRLCRTAMLLPELATFCGQKFAPQLNFQLAYLLS